MIGRLFGWTLITLAILTASAEAVMALGTGAYDGLAAGEMWTLLSGQTVSDNASLMHLPAWLIMGTLGFALLLACRRHKKRRMFVGQRSAALH